MTAAPIIELDKVSKRFAVGGARLPFSRSEQAMVHAVEQVSLSLYPGQTLGVVGESGCGKTTTAKLILRLEQPTNGRILFHGKDITTARGDTSRAYRRAVQAVFQNPASSLSPRMRVRELVVEPLIAHGLADRREQADRAARLLDLVGLSPAAANRYPHEFSGGQKQRIAIARALSLNPEVVVLDEPVSALDVSIRAQIVNLLQDLQEELNLSYLLIAHDLAVVEHMGHTVAVMYLGAIVESGPGETIAREPLHPYTRARMSAAPVPDPTVKVEPLPLFGELPSPINPPSGCRFHTRCPHAMPVCSEVTPELQEQEPGHHVACHLY
jgi:oligopeptide/dipeptide ABC transporter ATP-binding protein